MRPFIVRMVENPWHGGHPASRSSRIESPDLNADLIEQLGRLQFANVPLPHFYFGMIRLVCLDRQGIDINRACDLKTCFLQSHGQAAATAEQIDRCRLSTGAG
jgi:hypothetical protein